MRDARKVLPILMSAVLAVSLCPGLAFAADNSQTILQSGDFKYRIVDNEAWITGYTGNATDLVTPTSLGGYPVTCIDERGLAGHSSLKILTISEGVRDSMKMSYADNKNLEAVYFPSTYKSIYGCAFTGCSSLVNIEVDARNSRFFSRDGNMYARRGNSASELYFYAYGKPETEFAVPSDVTSIWIGFRETVHLRTLNIGDSVQTISNSLALEGDSIETINIGKGLRDVDDWIECGASLKTINVSVDNPAFCSEGGILYSKNKSTLYTCPANYPGGTPIINERTNAIAHTAIASSKNLLSITFNGKISSMSSSSFSYCNEGANPLRVYFNKGVDVAGIDEGAFWHSDVWLIGDSSVEQAAAKTGVPYLPGFDLSKAIISGLDNVSYGTEVEPVVRLGTAELLEGRDYKVVHNGNESTGTATLRIEGIGDFSGTITREYPVEIDTPTNPGATDPAPKPSAPKPGNADKPGTSDPEPMATQVMYRAYNPNSGEHFYTAHYDEVENVVAAGWRYEGEAWTAPVTSATPVYRLYSGTDHHYTTSVVERDHLTSVGWSDEGIGWYSDDNEGIGLHRLFNPNVDSNAPTNNSGSHHYTTSEVERDHLVSIGWRYEDFGWYGVR